MAITIGSDEAGKQLKEVIKSYLLDNKYGVIDATKEQEVDFIDATLAVARDVRSRGGNLGIAIDTSGVGSFMVAAKIKGMIAAEVSDERSGYMTRGHNNSRMITTRSKVVGGMLAKNVVEGFAKGKCDGDKHQVHVNMFNEMC